jgi:6-phosphogluconolactonase
MSGEPALRLPASVSQHAFLATPVMVAALAQHVATALRAAIAQRGQALLLVSGGRSPVALFERLSHSEIEWARVTVGLVDERCVAGDSADRNDALVRQHLMQGNAAQLRFIPLIGDGADALAELAGAKLRVARLPLPADVVVLGMGEDGHTASWFPAADETAAAIDPETTEQVAIVRPRTAAHTRLTLTLPVILGARQILLPVQGAKKLTVLERAGEAGTEVAELPVAAVLRQTATPVHVYHGP